jgi:hypothetical protein
MGELDFRGDVADREDVGSRGAHIVVDVDCPARCEVHAEEIEAKVFDVGAKSDTDERTGGVH